MKECATMEQHNDLIKNTQQYAMNSELKALYNKIVPPAAMMEQSAKDMEVKCMRLTEAVTNFDKLMSLKASRQDFLALDNKFRLFVKKEKYKPFVETTELEAQDLKAEVNGLIDRFDDLRKVISIEINKTVRKMTSDLRT